MKIRTQTWDPGLDTLIHLNTNCLFLPLLKKIVMFWDHIFCFRPWTRKNTYMVTYPICDTVIFQKHRYEDTFVHMYYLAKNIENKDFFSSTAYSWDAFSEVDTVVLELEPPIQVGAVPGGRFGEERHRFSCVPPSSIPLSFLFFYF
jgi:hypothetical protein